MGGTTTMHGCPPLCTSDQKQQPAVRAQGPNTYRSRCFLPILTPTSCVQAALGTHAQWPTTWLGVGHGQLLLCQELKLNELNCNLLPKPSPGIHKPSWASRVPEYNRQFLTVQLLSSEVEEFLVLPTQHVPRILMHRFLCERFFACSTWINVQTCAGQVTCKCMFNFVTKFPKLFCRAEVQISTPISNM